MARIWLALIIGLLISACTRPTAEDTRTSLRLQLPAAFSLSQKNWGIGDPDSLSGYNCYAVFLEIPNRAPNTCSNTSGHTVATPTRWYGGFWAGSSVEISVDAEVGTNRRISILGTKTPDQATCERLHAGVARSEMSSPAILGSVTMDIVANQVNNAEIEISYASRIAIDDCSGPEFNFDQPPTTSPNTSLTVQALYSGRDAWNDYVFYDGGGDFTATNADCKYASTRCIHAGRMKKVVTGFPTSSCGSMKITDSLNAFVWRCVGLEGKATFVAHDFKPGKGLKDLINSNLEFIPNSVTVTQGDRVIGASTAGNWWSTTSILALPDAGAATQNLTVENAIYVATSSLSNQRGWYIGAAGIGVVTLPGVHLTGNSSTTFLNCNSSSGNTSTPDAKCLIFGGAISAGSYLHRAWIEASLKIPGGPNIPGYNILLASAKHSHIHETQVQGILGASSGKGIALVNSISNRLSHVSVSSLDYGIYLNASNFNVIRDSIFSNHNSYGATLQTSSTGNTFYNTVVSNNSDGIYVNLSERNTFINTFVLANANAGMNVTGNKNTVVNLTTVNNGTVGLYLGPSSLHNTATGLLTLNNGTGVDIQSGVSSTILTNMYLMKDGIGLSSYSSTAEISSIGSMWIDRSAGCSLNAAPIGLSSADCTGATGVVSSNSALTPTFIGSPLTIDDIVNGYDSDSGTAGAAVVGNTIQDWVHFATPTRAWALNGTLDAATRGKCLSGSNCVVYDLKIAATDASVRNINGTYSPTDNCPASANGDTKIMTTYQHATSSKYLMNAVEVLDRPQGNNNGLCESYETCVYSPNIGAYQGDGELVGNCSFTGTTIQTVNLLGFSQN